MCCSFILSMLKVCLLYTWYIKQPNIKIKICFDSSQARIQEFSSGGVQPSEKILISKKKKKKKKKTKTKQKKGEREGASVFILH